MTLQQPEHDRTRSIVPLISGTEVAQYRIVERIGAGGMGEVYLADDTRLNRRVALKFLPAQTAQDTDARARFTREAQSAAKLDHPSIVTIHEVGEFDNRPFFAMQYVEGKTLQHYCQVEPLAVSDIVDIILQVAEGLSRAHGNGITHRDIKTANIILDAERRPRILDFGLATVAGGDALTQAGSTLGTFAYMSPEQARGEEIDSRSDIFSLGVVLYELLAGETPFRRANDAATLNAILNEAPSEPKRSGSELPEELVKLTMKCLNKGPDDRYQTVDEMLGDLRRVSGELSSQSSPAIDTVKQKPSIAVLPFANMSADPENEFFADGLTEELLNVLAKNPEMKVTGRTSSFAFKGKQEDLRGIGKKLGVTTILEGSVRKAGNRVRITAQLVNTTDGFHLWSETYDRVLEDIFAVQDDIASAVADALHVTLIGDTAAQHAVDPESYELTLRGSQLLMQFTQSATEMAAELFKKAIDRDEKNARAWAGLARAHVVGLAYGYREVGDDGKSAIEQAKEYVHKALELDDTLAEAHDVLSWIYVAFEYDWDAAEEAGNKAYELAPGSSRMMMSVAMRRLVHGRMPEAIAMVNKAVAVDPLDPELHLQRGRILAYAGELDEGIEAVKTALRLSPGVTTANVILSWIYIAKGQLELALEYAQKEKGAGYRLCGLAIAHWVLGQKEKADAALADLLKLDSHWAFQFANVYAIRGEFDRAFEWLNRAYEAQDAGIPLVRIHPLLKPLRSDPRFKAFLQRIGLTD